MTTEKLLILKRLTAHLETISVAGGYFNDLAGKVFRGRMVFGDETTEPFVSLMEAPRQIDPFGGGGDSKAQQNEAWTLLAQGIAQDDKLHPTDPAYLLLGDVQRAFGRLIETHPNTGNPLYPDEYMLGGLVSDFRFQVPIVRPPEKDVSPVAIFYFPFTVDVVTNLANPYVQED
jgi:hypothetical protein